MILREPLKISVKIVVALFLLVTLIQETVLHYQQGTRIRFEEPGESQEIPFPRNTDILLSLWPNY